jgi:hypothetical protein
MRSRWYSRTSGKYLKYLNSAEWRKKREQVIERSGSICERCHHYVVAEVHHLTYDRVYHEALEDLQGLCGYCHAFLHGERADDGNAVYERLVGQLSRAQAEITRFEEHPEFYRVITESQRVPQRDLVALFQQHPRLISVDTEFEIIDVRIAKRKYETAVTFKERASLLNGYSLAVVKNAEELLFAGKMVLDIERQLWVHLHIFRWFVRSHGVV